MKNGGRGGRGRVGKSRRFNGRDKSRRAKIRWFRETIRARMGEGEGMMRTENEDTTFVERERGGNVLNSFWRRPIYERGPSRRGHQEFISQIKTPVKEGWRRGGCSRNFSTVVERRGEGGGVEIRE